MANLLLLVLLAASLVQSGWRSVYGVVVLVLALVAQLVQRQRGLGRSSGAGDPKTSPTGPGSSR